MALVVTTVAACRTGEALVTDPNVEVPVLVGLTRDQAGLSAAAKNVNDPTQASQFRQFLNAETIRNRFGAKNGEAALSNLASRGLINGRLDPTGSIISGSMKVSDAATLFNVDFASQLESDGARVVTTTGDPQVPEGLGIQEVAGLAIQTQPASSAQSTGTDQQDQECPPATGVTARLSEHYGLDQLLGRGGNGSKSTIALLEMDQLAVNGLAKMASCFRMTLPKLSVTRAPATPDMALAQGSTESTLDIVAASLFAPGLKGVDVHQFSPHSSITSGISSAVSSALTPDGPRIISTSVGVCETDLEQGELEIAEWSLAAAAAAGITTLSSAGDTGSSGCAPGQANESVQYPASSIYVTAIGGTQLQAEPTGEVDVVWNESPGQEIAAGGARTSQFPRPWYQQNLPAEFGGQRLVPDIALDASPQTFGTIDVCQGKKCSWELIGGTSATAPAVAAGLAVLSEDLGGGNPIRLGWLNPPLYTTFDKQKYSGAFIDIRQGNNDLYNVGCCQARRGYDPASGIGTINIAALARELQLTTKPPTLKLR